MFTRTKTLDCYSDCADKIYEASKALLLNEWNNNQKKLSLRLIGVRCSDLIDKSLAENGDKAKHKASISRCLSESKIKIDSYFKKIDKTSQTESREKINVEMMPEEGIESYVMDTVSFFLICPHCESSFEGNKEFIDQHVDFCCIQN